MRSSRFSSPAAEIVSNAAPAPAPRRTDVLDVLVVGGGPAGLMCAREAAGRGLRVLVLEQSPLPGRKLVVSGGGRANFTNRRISPLHYRCGDPAFCAPALKALSPAVMERLAAAWGLPTEERAHEQLFLTVPARNLLHCLLDDLRARGGDIRLRQRVLSVRRTADGFDAATDNGPVFARAVVLAAGSPAWPQAGGSTAGFDLARALGHRLVPPFPALTPLLLPPEALAAPVRDDGPSDTAPARRADGSRRLPPAARAAKTPPEAKRHAHPGAADTRPRSGETLAGISLPVRISLPEAGLPPALARDPLWKDDLLFTHEGLSGPAALKASLFWEEGMPLVADFLPDTAFRDVLDDPAAGRRTPTSLLRRHMPQRLAERLLPPDLARRRTAELSRKARETLCAAVHAHRLFPSGRADFRKAEVCGGGVDVREVDPRRMESRIVPGLYLVGEMLDVTGLLGGYNLHWAWASGMAAGRAVPA